MWRHELHESQGWECNNSSAAGVRLPHSYRAVQSEKGEHSGEGGGASPPPNESGFVGLIGMGRGDCLSIHTSGVGAGGIASGVEGADAEPGGRAGGEFCNVKVGDSGAN